MRFYSMSLPTRSSWPLKIIIIIIVVIVTTDDTQQVRGDDDDAQVFRYKKKKSGWIFFRFLDYTAGDWCRFAYKI